MKAGRPPIIIDWKKVDMYLEASCDGTEIAAHLGIHPDTLYSAGEREGFWGEHTDYPDFSAYKAAKKAAGDALLKVQQFNTAMKGNVPMQIWLGKQRLGQKERIEEDVKETVHLHFDKEDGNL